MAGTLTVAGLVSGLPSGSRTIGPLTMTGTAVIGQTDDLTLATGDTTVTVPAGATAALIVMDAANTGAVTVRTNLNSGDAGLPFAIAGWMAFPLASGVTSLILNSGGGVSCELSFI